MNYEVLKEKEMKLMEELQKIRREIAKAEEVQAINLLSMAIKSLEDVENILTNPECDFEVYCEECNENFDTYVSLADVIQSLRILKERIK